MISEGVLVVFRDCLDIEAVLVHGSYAKGVARPDSDLDLAVLLRRGEKYTDYERAQLAAEVSLVTGKDVDIGILSSENLVYAKEAFEHGEPVFIRDNFYFELMRATLLSMYLNFNEDRKEVLDAWTAR